MITALYAAILALFYIGLTIFVVLGRYKHKIGLGDNANPAMLRRVRMHGNFAEYVPFALLLLFFVDYLRFSDLIVHALGILLVLSRVLHVWGLSQSSAGSLGRTGGMIMTMLFFVICAILLLWKYIVIHVIGF